MSIGYHSTANAKAKRLGFHVDSTAESNRKRAKVPLQTILDAFKEHGTYQKAAKAVGLDAYNVRTRLIKNGVDPSLLPVSRKSRHDLSSIIPAI